MIMSYIQFRCDKHGTFWGDDERECPWCFSDKHGERKDVAKWALSLSNGTIDLMYTLLIRSEEEAIEAIESGRLWSAVKKRNGFGKKSYFDLCDFLSIDPPENHPFSIHQAIALLELNGYEVKKL